MSDELKAFGLYSSLITHHSSLITFYEVRSSPQRCGVRARARARRSLARGGLVFRGRRRGQRLAQAGGRAHPRGAGVGAPRRPVSLGGRLWGAWTARGGFRGFRRGARRGGGAT